MRNLILFIVSLVCFAGLVGCSGSTSGGGNHETTATISAVSVSGTTATTVTITWTTNVGSSSRVDYGTTTAYGSNVSDSSLVTSHSMTLTSLTCNTTYHYQITSAAAPGNSATTTDATLTTGACPAITGVSVSGTTATTVTITWTTNVGASSRVDYGTTTAYGSNVSDSGLVTSHSLNLTSLTCNTTYHYQITSAVAPGDSASTSDATFTTDVCQISITGVSVTTAANSATVAWTTNVAGTSVVNYGLTSQYGFTASDSSLLTSHSLMLSSLACNTTYHYQITSVGSSNSATTADATFTTDACGGPVSDDFHGPILNPMWHFYAQCCGFEKMTGTDASLIVPSVTSHNIFAQNQGVGLLQTIADVDFTVETKFDSIVTQGDQEEGIFVQQDAQNFIWFGVYNDGTTPRLYAVVTIGGTPSGAYDNPITITPGSTSFWMRVSRTGTSWTQSWSTDGSTYSTATLTQALTVSGIGPAGGNSLDSSNHPAPSFTAEVDYFFNTTSPISPTDGGMPTPPNQPLFNIWYGDNQTFGQNGIPQQWVNILGNVSAPSGIASASYTLNGGAPQALRVGPGLGFRTVDTGDFNVEIDHADLSAGANTVVISATDNMSNTTTHTVTLNWNNTGQVWPLPYSVDWSTVTNIQSVAQIVDGQWAIQPDGSVRTEQVGYDRLLAIGDASWTDYQVTSEITINTLDCSGYSFGIIVGWQGHTTDLTQPPPDQPRTGHPFPGYGSYSTTPTAVLNIYANSANFPEQPLIKDTTGLTLSVGVKYVFKFAVQRNSNNTTSHFSLKVWPAGTTEPGTWNLQADGDASTGSFLLIAHQADVSFGKVDVVALP